MKYFSTFSGIGGFELAITQAYENLQCSKRLQQKKLDRNRNMPNIRGQIMAAKPLCIGYSEIDKYAIQVYQKQFPNHKNLLRITPRPI